MWGSLPERTGILHGLKETLRTASWQGARSRRSRLRARSMAFFSSALKLSSDGSEGHCGSSLGIGSNSISYSIQKWLAGGMSQSPPWAGRALGDGMAAAPYPPEQNSVFSRSDPVSNSGGKAFVLQHGKETVWMDPASRAMHQLSGNLRCSCLAPIRLA